VELEDSLLAWEESPEDSELMGRIFRAMHTIKGSGSMFGFDNIAAFTHEIETVFDLARNGRIKFSRELVDLTLAARDQIKAMLVADGEPDRLSVQKQNELRAVFKSMADEAAGPVSGTRSKPAAVQAGAINEPAREITCRIHFRPREDIFLTGTNPILLLNELRGLGRTTVAAQLDDIPLLTEINPESCYVGWEVILTTGRGIEAIRDVFIFVEDDCELRIDLIDDGGALNDDVNYKRLGELLVERGDLAPRKLEEVLTRRPPLGELLIDSGLVAPEKVESALGEQEHVRSIRNERLERNEQSSIRVQSDRLDKLVDLVGEMVTVQARLSQAAARFQHPDLLSISEEVERLTAELRDNAMSTRMVPIGSLFNKFKRLVRDLSHELGKDIEMVTRGAETELDKTVIERLSDPLIHLIRNSIDHGIELPEVREAAGKPRRGRLTISGAHAGAHVLISIRDDGAGLNLERIRARAVESGLIGPDKELSRQEVADLIFTPGFSTSTEVTGVSGRGVGMDVVKKNIESLKGSIEIISEDHTGTEMILKLPLTLAIIDGLLVRVGDNHFVLPMANIRESVELTARDISNAHGRTTVTVRNELVPYIRLRDRFDIKGERPEIEQVVISEVDAGQLGLVVDRVIGGHQTVIKSLGPMFKNVSDISGATILGDGHVALIMDVNKLGQIMDAERGRGLN